MKRRHYSVGLAFGVMVLIPVIVTWLYLWFIAEDQYASVTGFTVRSEDSNAATELVGGLTQFVGGSSASDTDILVEFIQSAELVSNIHASVDLESIYTINWPNDPVFALKPGASIERLQSYWNRMVRISYDQGAGLIELRVLSFDPDHSKALAEAIIAECQKMINGLNAAAREDTMRHARADLEEALKHLRKAREDLTAFRTRTQIVDPQADIQGRMGVLNNLQQQLAEALINHDLLAATTQENDPRLQQVNRRIEAIRERIALERESFTLASVGSGQEDYPSLIAEFESLSVDREFAEQTYTTALAALEIARSNANRQSRYLATYVRPTKAETPRYPQRYLLVGLVAFFAILLWSIATLIYFSLRDRR